MKRFFSQIFSLFFILMSFCALSQNTVVKGKIIDAKTKETIPFATVVFTGTQDGTISDIDGQFSIKTSKEIDSIEVAYVGFIRVVKPIKRGERQEINFELEEDVKELEAVIIKPGEDPAFPIMRKVKKNKIKNDLRILKAYNYEKYAKIELALQNAQKKIEGKKNLTIIMQQLDSLAASDTTSNLKWKKGETLLPYYMSETLSDYYYRKDPVLTHEKVKKTQSKGVKLSNGSVILNLASSAFQDYNFYENWITIFKKEFVSPIADSWRAMYDYDLVDSLFVDDDFCYRLKFQPKNSQSLAFTGEMLITKKDYAIKRIEAKIPASANINLVETVVLKQEMFRTRSGSWLPEKVNVLVDFEKFSEGGSGVLARYNCSMKGHQTNTPRSQKFYLNPYEIAQNAEENSKEYWKKNRHVKMSKTDQKVFNMMDSIKRVPNVSAIESIMNLVIYRYIPSGKFDIGPYTSFFGLNNVEGLRLGYAMRTRDTFSKKVRFGAFGAYGFKDKKIKYQLYTDLILNRKTWTNLHIEHSSDLEPIWYMNKGYGIHSYQYTFAHLGKMQKTFYVKRNIVSLERQLGTGLTQTVSIKREELNPNFDFSFLSNQQNPDGTFKRLSKFNYSELTFKTRFARDEVLILKNNERIRVLPNNFVGKWPIFEFSYSYGLSNFLGSDLGNYHKFDLKIIKRQKMGLFGLSWFKFGVGQIIGEVPFPLLFNPTGNQSFIYLKNSFNIMRFFEFSSDRQIYLFWRHSFEGIVMNKIPLIRKLKARLVLNVNALYGNMSDKNKKLSLEMDELGNPNFYTLEKKPYVEVGVGMENIFKLFFVQVYRRVTYLNHPGVNKFGVRFYTQVDF